MSAWFPIKLQWRDWRVGITVVLVMTTRCNVLSTSADYISNPYTPNIILNYLHPIQTVQIPVWLKYASYSKHIRHTISYNDLYDIKCLKTMKADYVMKAHFRFWHSYVIDNFLIKVDADFNQQICIATALQPPRMSSGASHTHSTHIALFLPTLYQIIAWIHFLFCFVYLQSKISRINLSVKTIYRWYKWLSLISL